jgi:hypothetical protein
MQMTFRPLPAWPYPEQPERPATYKATYQRTLLDLDRELEAVGAREVILGVVADPRDVRLDGQLRADAKVRHAGVELSFDKPGVGRVTFHTDRHRGYANSWQDNLRAIALGLEALRAVDRYGITTSGQQYAGFAALTAGPSLESLGAKLVEHYGGLAEALRATHPDTGRPDHTQRDFEAVMAYKRAGR